MKEISEYITEWVSSGKRSSRSQFPENIEDMNDVIRFLEMKGFVDAGTSDNMGAIDDLFNKTKTPVFTYNTMMHKGGYWLRFYDPGKNRIEITWENPIYTIEYKKGGNENYFIEVTKGSPTIKALNKKKFHDLLKENLYW